MPEAADAAWPKEQPPVPPSKIAADELAGGTARGRGIDPMGLDVMPRKSVLCVEREDKEDRADKAGDGGQDVTSSSSSLRASWIWRANDRPVDISSSGGKALNS